MTDKRLVNAADVIVYWLMERTGAEISEEEKKLLHILVDIIDGSIQ